MTLPTDRQYTSTHEWVKAEGDVLVVGISDPAQAQLGDLVFVGDVDVGVTLSQGQTAGVVESVKAAADVYMPISGTVTDASGRILSGQTVTAFWHSVRHAQPLAVGLNCALGAALMRPYIQELARVAGDTFISCYPNAGLPNPMSDTGFDETPDVTSRLLHEFAAEGLVNIVGGCCGTTPEHIAAIGDAVSPLQPRGVHAWGGYKQAA